MLFHNSFCDGRRCRRRRCSLTHGWLGLAVPFLFLPALFTTSSAFAADSKTPAKPKNRAESVRAVMAHLGLGEGAVVADVGAGGGADTWTFADIVGKTGTVYAEEIAEGMVKKLEKEAEKRALSQVRPVLGRLDDPCLPKDSVDLAYMRYVYHHVAKPREMLRGIWRALKPGGYFVVVDKNRGTLRDWVPRENRTHKHSWIAETTVMREAREEGFVFAGFAEDCWHAKDPFVFVFQRPKEMKEPGRDPDGFVPLKVEQCSHAFLPLRGSYRGPAFVALGDARKLIAPIMKHSSGEGIEIVLEEWATQKDEREPLPPGVDIPSVFTDKGDPRLGPEAIGAVFFLDSFHRLFHGKTLLAKIHDKLAPEGCVYVLDREAKQPLSRREASHRRQIGPETVREEMTSAGFTFRFEGPRLAPDRFLLVFGKSDPAKIAPEQDPFVAGPELSQPPEKWLKENLWRLRGLKTAGGKVVLFAKPGEQGQVEKVPGAPAGAERWRIRNKGQTLSLQFKKKGDAYVLTDCSVSDGKE